MFITADFLSQNYEPLKKSVFNGLLSLFMWTAGVMTHKIIKKHVLDYK